jgi:chromate transporter
MVLQFVGFMAGAHHARDLGLLGAVLGGLVATYFTFMPCFFWIFLGAPYIERGRGNRVVAGALGTVTAAVVGVILNLAVWFALIVLFPRQTVNVFGLVVAVLAFAALRRFKVGVIPVVAAAGLAGIAFRWLAPGP